jgi:hypothetical protein
MASSRDLCLSDAVYLFQVGRESEAEVRLESAAQYAWGFQRPAGWGASEVIPPAGSANSGYGYDDHGRLMRRDTGELVR